MKDFTLSTFKHYFQTIKSSFPNILRFDKYLFSELENEISIQETYDFRGKSYVFTPEIVSNHHQRWWLEEGPWKGPT